jgi:dTDP-glucose 4,6-dehydratase
MRGERLPLYGDGMQMRSWIHVQDHCRALLQLAEHEVVGEVFNIGGPLESELPNKVVAEKIIALLGKSTELIQHVTDRPAHDRKYAVDSAYISKLTGWKPTVLFDEGIRETVSWYQTQEPWWQKIVSGEYHRFYEQHYGERTTEPTLSRDGKKAS